MVGLDDARTRAITILADVKSGHDPLVIRQPSRMTFGELADQYLTEHALRAAPASTKEVRRMLNSDILPFLKPLRLDAVTKADVARVVERVATRGAFEAELGDPRGDEGARFQMTDEKGDIPRLG